MLPTTLIQPLIDRGNLLLGQPFEPIVFSGNPQADAMLNDLKQYPHAFLLACVMDRQIKAERAWLIPYHISQSVGGFEFSRLVELPLDQLTKIFHEKSLHRFNDLMAKNFYSALKRINDDFKGNAALIWNDRPKSATLVRRLLRFDGVGIKIASMAANILSRQFKIPLQDRYSIDISPDVQVKRVFERIGLIPIGASHEDLLYCARELMPQYPGIFDLSAWEIGRDWCRPANPQCSNCYLNAACPKIGVSQ